jgi:hypothetical protein
MAFKVRAQRYVEHYPVTKLTKHPKNPNVGDVGAIVESIEELGFYGVVLAQESTGFILAGNHRWEAAVNEGAADVPTLLIDCDDDEALKILLGDNRIADLRTYDDRKLADVLSEMRERSGLRGTGYDDNDLTGLLARMGSDRLREGGFAGNGDPLQGGPEVEGGEVEGGERAAGRGAGGGDGDAPAGLDDPGTPYKNQYAVAVFCTDEGHQQATFERLAGLGYKCKVLVV